VQEYASKRPEDSWLFYLWRLPICLNTIDKAKSALKTEDVISTIWIFG
jgi:hypothetical protein